MHNDNLLKAMAILGRMNSYDTEGKDPLAASALRQWAGEVRDALAAAQAEISRLEDALLEIKALVDTGGWYLNQAGSVAEKALAGEGGF